MGYFYFIKLIIEGSADAQKKIMEHFYFFKLNVRCPAEVQVHEIYQNFNDFEGFLMFPVYFLPRKENIRLFLFFKLIIEPGAEAQKK